MQHKLDIEYKNGLKDIAEDLADLRYDKTEKFLMYLAEKIEKDSNADYKRGRIKLSESLKKTAKSLMEAKVNMSKAWKISAPFMKDDGSC